MESLGDLLDTHPPSLDDEAGVLPGMGQTGADIERAAESAYLEESTAQPNDDDLRAAAARQRQKIKNRTSRMPPPDKLYSGQLLTLKVQRAMDHELSPPAFRLAVRLASIWAGDRDASTDRGTTGLAREMGYKTASGISRPLKNLADAGYVIIERRRSGRQGRFTEATAEMEIGPRWRELLDPPASAERGAAVPRSAEASRVASAERGSIQETHHVVSESLSVEPPARDSAPRRRPKGVEGREQKASRPRWCAACQCEPCFCDAPSPPAADGAGHDAAQPKQPRAEGQA